MRIVDFREFCTLPDGTVFQELDYGYAPGNLSVRYGVSHDDKGAPRDYVEREVGAVIVDAGCIAARSYDHIVHPSGAMRNGMYDTERKYLVHEAEDLRRMVCLLTGQDDGGAALMTKTSSSSQASRK